MASNTGNLGLYKKDPVSDSNDYFDVKTMLNDNWDKIDGKYKNTDDKLNYIEDEVITHKAENADVIKNITGKPDWKTVPRTTLENAVKRNGDTMLGDLNIGTHKIKFDSGTQVGTDGIASSDSGAIYGEHDENTETSRLVIELLDNYNDKIVFRAQKSGKPVTDIATLDYYSTTFLKDLIAKGLVTVIGSGSTQDNTTDTYDEGVTILGGNQRLVMDVSDNTNGGAYIQVRHRDATYPGAYYNLNLNPIGGYVLANGKVVLTTKDKSELVDKINITRNNSGDDVPTMQSNSSNYLDVRKDINSGKLYICTEPEGSTSVENPTTSFQTMSIWENRKKIENLSQPQLYPSHTHVFNTHLYKDDRDFILNKWTTILTLNSGSNVFFSGDISVFIEDASADGRNKASKFQLFGDALYVNQSFGERFLNQNRVGSSKISLRYYGNQIQIMTTETYKRIFVKISGFADCPVTLNTEVFHVISRV